MDTMWRLGLLIHKEWADLRHQPVFLAVAAAAPFFLFIVFYLIWSADVTLPIDLVNNAGARGDGLVRAMATAAAPGGTPYLAVRPLGPGALARRPAEYVAMVEIPADFVRDREAVIHYGAENENTVKNYINRLHAAQTELLRDRLGYRPVTVVEQNRYPTDVPARQAMAVGLTAYAFLLSGTIFGGVLAAREFEDQTVRLIRVAPVRRWLVLASKGTVAVGLTLAAGAVYAGLAAGLLAGARPSAWGVFVAAGLGTAVTGVLCGLAAGLLLRRNVPVFLTGLAANLAMWIVGGGFGKLGLYPAWQQAAGRLLPYTHGMELFWYSYFGGRARPPGENAAGLALTAAAALGALVLAARHTLVRER